MKFSLPFIAVEVEFEQAWKGVVDLSTQAAILAADASVFVLKTVANATADAHDATLAYSKSLASPVVSVPVVKEESVEGLQEKIDALYVDAAELVVTSTVN